MKNKPTVYVLIILFSLLALLAIRALYLHYHVPSIVYAVGTREGCLKLFQSGAKTITIPYQKEECLTVRNVDSITSASPKEYETVPTTLSRTFFFQCFMRKWGKERRHSGNSRKP